MGTRHRDSAARGEEMGEVAGKGLLRGKVGGIERSVEGLQGLVCHCQPF